jgi:glutaredoxin 3
MSVTVYSTTYCGYCRAAEDLLRRQNIPFEKIDVTNDPATREALVARANGRRTVPVIFHGDEVIGGYVELAAMIRSGEFERRFPRRDAA